MSLADDIPSVREMLDRSKIMASLAPLGLSPNEREMVFDMTAKAVDDATKAMFRTLDTLEPGTVAMQATSMAMQIFAVAYADGAPNLRRDHARTHAGNSQGAERRRHLLAPFAPKRDRRSELGSTTGGCGVYGCGPLQNRV